MNQQQEQYHKELAQKGAKVLADAGLKATGRMELGDPRSVLVEAARREKADLIVIGSHGRSGVAKLLLGSVASHIVGHAPCNVLVVKRPA
jgi:nucleotide-binding universal stress UspA family protein